MIHHFAGGSLDFIPRKSNVRRPIQVGQVAPRKSGVTRRAGGASSAAGSRSRTPPPCAVVGPAKARRPEISWYTHSRDENKSLRASIGRPCSCSGDMSCTVPTTSSATVAVRV